MFKFQLKCPHCLNSEYFSIRSPVDYHAPRPPALAGNKNDQTSIPSSTVDGNEAKCFGVAYCPRPNCAGPVLIWFESARMMFSNRGNYGSNIEWVYAGPQPRILGTWPSAPSTDDSENWPEKLRTIFREIQEDIRMKRDPSRIVGACRSVLEVALANLGYDKAKGKNLSDRIDSARAEGILTESMKQWAHKTRMDGNEALHELEATQEEAKELVDFIKTFLEIVFDLPERIKILSSRQS